MKEGRDLNALLAEVLRQSETKHDYLAPSRCLAVTTSEAGTSLELATTRDLAPLPLKDTAHGQLAERLGIPKVYYDRMREEAPTLFDANVNHWLASSEDRRLVRTLDGRARAILSDRYRVLDNLDLASVAVPVLQDHGFELVSAELTEKKLYLKATTPKIQAEVRRGDVVQAGVVISNSEVGHGTLKIEPLLFFLVCTNGLVMPEAAMRRQHVGRHIGDLEGGERYYLDETRQADDLAFWLKVRDTLVGTLREPAFLRHLETLKGATEQPIQADPFEVVEVTARRFRLAEAEKNGVLRHLLAGHNGRVELNKYGLMQAVTRASKDVDDYDRATELEQLGGQIIELPPSQWKLIAEARA
ncbi:DUF932 domain-containing protein [Tautonia sociabilis]|uniref:DUF932 domain-containing protein n=1 Tax=Tautonia sociabilis TaxID=2080755 RepID=A0A432MHZ4_9BACT|nr:DUF932 domain-containing protein [Tautonia sociabilis]RUL86982.1 DUF932 domain-containing protein [Tautonia sociabilis]